jgi:nucleotidyltransferase substrate binding protein (TIGR01987 family)
MIDTAYTEKCIATLVRAFELLQKSERTSIEYLMYRSACIKEFEIILEMSGKLLRKALKPYFHTGAAVDRLYFKDVFRHAVKHGLLEVEGCERWLNYRDSRNTTAHDYGEDYANETLALLPTFIADATQLMQTINAQNP